MDQLVEIEELDGIFWVFKTPYWRFNIGKFFVNSLPNQDRNKKIQSSGD